MKNSIQIQIDVSQIVEKIKDGLLHQNIVNVYQDIIKFKVNVEYVKMDSNMIHG